jgi:hypothetical protein
MKKVSLLLLLILVTLTLHTSGHAQGICPIITLKVNRISGKILWNDKNAQPITKTKVELKRLDEKESLTASTITNDLGFFEINNIKTGKYGLDVLLSVDEKPYFVYRIALKVKKSNATKSESIIALKLGLDCFNSEARIIK